MGWRRDEEEGWRKRRDVGVTVDRGRLPNREVFGNTSNYILLVVFGKLLLFLR